MRPIHKLSMLTLLSLSSLTSASWGKGTIHEVVVYPDRAQVTRRTLVTCGTRVLVPFAKLPPAADLGSLRARTSVGTMDGLRVEQHSLAEAYSKSVQELVDKQRTLQTALAVLQAAAQRDATALRLADQYEGAAQTLIGRELLDSGGAGGTGGKGQRAVEAWTQAMEATLATRLHAATEQEAREPKKRVLLRQLEEVQLALGEQRAAAQKRELTAEVLITCPGGAQAAVDLSYLVGGASWSAAHEARLQDASGRVTIKTFATLMQSTGEDWLGSRLILSTARPRLNATPPEIAALRVFADPRERQTKILVSRAEDQVHLEEPGSTATAPARGRRAQAQGLSVQFLLAEAADVPGDGTPSRLLLTEHAQAAQLTYRAAPKLLPWVFRVADLNNGAEHPLLPGPIEIYRHGQYVAQTMLSYVPAGGRMQITFGVEERLRIKRDTVEEVAQDKGLLGRTRRHNYHYRFEIANYLGTKAEIEVAEHIPVSELDDVKVLLRPETTAGYQVQAADGLVRWKLPLGAGEKRVLSLSYAVDVPQSYLE